MVGLGGLGTIARLIVAITADTAGLESALSGAENKVKSFAAKLEEKIDTRAFLTVGAAISGVGLVLGGLLVKTGLTAARVEVLETVLNVVGKTAGYSASFLKKQEDVIKALGITTKGAREILILFMQSQLDVADASKISRVAQDLAVISGENSSQAAVTLTNAISTLNPMLLRQYGIVKNLDEILTDYGKELGIITEKVDKSGKTSQSWSRDLTEVEKKQALINVILREGEKVAGTYEAAMEKAGKALTSLPRFIEEAELALGEAFIPVIGKVIEVLSELLKSFIALPPETKTLITHIIMGVAAFALITGAILTFIGLLPTLVAGFGILVGPVGIVIAILAALGGIIYLIYRNWDTVGPKIMGIWEKIKNFLIRTWNILKPKAIEIFGKIKEFLINTWETLKPIVITVWGIISNYLIRVWEKISTKLIPAAIRLQERFNEINKVVMAKLVPVFKKLWEILKPIIIVIGLLVGALIWLAAEGFLFLIDALVFLIDEFLNLGKTWEKIKTKAIEIWGMIKDFFINLWEDIKTKIIETWDSIKEFFVELWESIKTKVIGTWEGIKQFFIDIWEGIKNTFIEKAEEIWAWMLNWIPFLNLIVTEWGPTVIKLFRDIWEKIKIKAIEIWTAISNFFKNIWDIIYSFFKSKIDAIRDYITSRFTTIKTKTINIWNSIRNFLASLWNSIKTKAIEIWNSIRDFFVRTWDSIKAKIISVWNPIKNFFINLWNSIKTKAIGVWNSIKNFLRDTWNSIINRLNTFREGFLNVWNRIKDGLKSPLNAAIRLINSFLSKVEKAANKMIQFLSPVMPGLKGLKISIPKIPELQLGGYITKAGFVDVGERGRERIFLPKGAEVRPLEKMLPSPVKQEIHIHSEYNEELASKTFAKLFAQYVGVINK